MIPISPLKSPFVYFGGKSVIAPIIWQHLGNPRHYLEPFLGSAACLLARPSSIQSEINAHPSEIVNDKNGYISNAWRSLKANPEKTCYYASYYGYNENDLHAVHSWLVQPAQSSELVQRLEGNLDYYDPKIAGFWLWGMALWIGGLFCGSSGPWHSINGKLINVNIPEDLNDSGIKEHLPRISANQGIATQRPQLPNAQGIWRQIPYLRDGGNQGITRKRPMLGHYKAQGIINYQDDLLSYFQALSTRLQHVKVCSGDWSRIMNLKLYEGTIGVFLDPPYTHGNRDSDLYNHDDSNIALTVQQWAIEHGSDTHLRIAYCGYDDQSLPPFPPNWTAYHWKAQGGYGNVNPNNQNKHKECVWFSPGCLSPDQIPTQTSLFTMPEVTDL